MANGIPGPGKAIKYQADLRPQAIDEGLDDFPSVPGPQVVLFRSAKVRHTGRLGSVPTLAIINPQGWTMMTAVFAALI